jgi:catechol 2,3-dioxygenase-like lactoylglutathione lyase family enzyme
VLARSSALSVTRVFARLLTLVVDAHDPARLARFWSAVLGRDVVDHPRGLLLAGSDTQIGLRFTPSDARRTGPDRVHLHLTSARPDDQQRTVESALGLGATPLDVGQLPEEGHVVLADPEGNAFCVIEAGNAFLAGCGFLGEVACEGTREVGLFWAEALGWPLVWDQDQETAVQSPGGGTKVAWGGPPVAPQHGRNRQRFEVEQVGGGTDVEVERLVALGATCVGTAGNGTVELTDPDGNAFSLVGRSGR